MNDAPGHEPPLRTQVQAAVVSWFESGYGSLYPSKPYLTATPLMPHARMAATDAASLGPSKIPQRSMHAYCVPERFAPRSCSTLPLSSTV